ncbi:hypothetical protein [Streptomyces sp. NPDC051132]|uniref:hypothetical protein n=1 Tax=unclassified Streptomyces TaxID=2593676 RepID=UPI0034283B6F
MPDPTPDAIRTTPEALTRITEDLHLNKDTGVPVLLGDILCDAARLASDQAGRTATDEIRLIINGLQEASQEATDWHVLHFDFPRVHQHFNHSAMPQDER